MIGKRVILTIFLCFILSIAVSESNTMVCKAETDYTWITKTTKDNKNPFKNYMKNFKIQARSLYKLLSVVFMTAVACATIFSGTGLTFKNSTEKRKSWQVKLLCIFIVVIIFFGMAAIFNLAEQIGKTIFLTK